MDMATYLASMERAVKHLLPKVWEDDLRIADAETAVHAAERAVEDGYRYVEGILADPYDQDEDGLATMVYWETYFERTEEQTRREGEVRRVAGERDEHGVSSAMLAGMVLELAKRGITMVHGGLQPCAPRAQTPGREKGRDASGALPLRSETPLCEKGRRAADASQRTRDVAAAADERTRCLGTVGRLQVAPRAVIRWPRTRQSISRMCTRRRTYRASARRSTIFVRVQRR